MTSLALFTWLLAMMAPQQQPQFAGTVQCATCHEDIASNFRRNPHFKLEGNYRGTSGQGCESCHGPGAEHVESLDITKIRSFKMLTARQSAAACLDCHKNEAVHSNRLFDAHTRKAVTCTSCHSVHGGAAETPLLQRTTNDLCATCHVSERARFERPFSHRLARNAMDCVSCHAPHGSEKRPQLTLIHSNQAACLNCHGDKRGPFAFEHMPVKVGGCVSCHEPHGSANPRMLVRQEVRQVCLECHTNSTSALGKTPPAFHDLRSDRFRNCTICHTKVHGSHTSPSLLR